MCLPVATTPGLLGSLGTFPHCCYHHDIYLHLGSPVAIVPVVCRAVPSGGGDSSSSCSVCLRKDLCLHVRHRQGQVRALQKQPRLCPSRGPQPAALSFARFSLHAANSYLPFFQITPPARAQQVQPGRYSSSLTGCLPLPTWHLLRLSQGASDHDCPPPTTCTGSHLSLSESGITLL